MLRSSVMSSTRILEYLATPSSRRPISLFQPDLLGVPSAFGSGQAERLRLIGAMPGKMDARMAQRFLIDLSWASSHLEGNTFTQLDTQTLIEWGDRPREESAENAVMILNHKRAIEYMLKLEVLEVDSICEIHKCLARNGGEEGSRHFLPDNLVGKLREYGEVEISGSSYLPPSSLGQEMRTELSRIAAASMQADPLNGAFHLMSRLPYLQPFMDVNKRTSRICANVPLLSHGMAPFTFVGVDRVDYHRGMVGFYELGDDSLLKEVFVKSYALNAIALQSQDPALRAALVTSRNEISDEIVRFVENGKAVDDERLASFLERKAESRTVAIPKASGMGPKL